MGTHPVERGAKLGAIPCGLVRTAMDARNRKLIVAGCVDTAWRSTDQKVGGSSPSGRAAGTLLGRGFLSSAAELDSPCAFVGPRLGRDVSSPDIIEPSDERVDIEGEWVGMAAPSSP